MFGGEPLFSFSDHIRELMSRTGQSEARLADDLAHDINVWAPYRAIMQAVSKGKTGMQRTQRSAPPPGVDGFSNTRTVALAPQSRAAGSAAAGVVTPGSPSQDAATPRQLTHPNELGCGDKAKSKPGPKLGAIARFREKDLAVYSRIEALMKDQHLSLAAATERLAEEGMLAGSGTSKSKATRLRRAYTKDKRLFPTKSN